MSAQVIEIPTERADVERLLEKINNQVSTEQAKLADLEAKIRATEQEIVVLSASYENGCRDLALGKNFDAAGVQQKLATLRAKLTGLQTLYEEQKSALTPLHEQAAVIQERVNDFVLNEQRASAEEKQTAALKKLEAARQAVILAENEYWDATKKLQTAKENLHNHAAARNQRVFCRPAASHLRPAVTRH